MIKHNDGSITHVGLVLSIGFHESTANDSYSKETYAVVFNPETQETETVELSFICQGPEKVKAIAEVDALPVYRDILEKKRLEKLAAIEERTIRIGKKVQILSGRNKNAIVEVFWEGKDKFNAGQCFGVKTEKGTFFINQYSLEVYKTKLEKAL